MTNRTAPLHPAVIAVAVVVLTSVVYAAEGYMAAVALLLGASVAPAARAIHDNAVEANPGSQWARAMRALHDLNRTNR